MTVDVLGDSNRGVPHLFRHDLQGNFDRDQERRTRVSKLVDGPVTKASALTDLRHGLAELLRVERRANCRGENQAPLIAPPLAPNQLFGLLTHSVTLKHLDERRRKMECPPAPYRLEIAEMNTTLIPDQLTTNRQDHGILGVDHVLPREPQDLTAP